MEADRRLIADTEVKPVRGNGLSPQEESLGELFRDLADESVELMREEVTLAKLEMKQTATALTKDVVKVVVAASIAAVGGLALVAALIMVLGEILGDAYWAGALIVGALFLLIGGIMAKSAISDMKQRDLKPDETIETLREDKRWAKTEAREFKREVTS